MRARTARALGWVVVAAGMLVPAVPGHAAATCARDIELVNQWSAVPLPRTSGPVAIAQRDEDPCSVIATDTHRQAFRSNDGGLHWSTPIRLPEDVVRPVVATFGADRVALIASAGGLLVSGNGGRSFTKASGLDGVQVLSLRADPTERARVYATGRAGSVLPPGTVPPAVPVPSTGGPSMWISYDFGQAWQSVPTSAPLGASAVSVDPRQPKLVWANAATAGGLWLSDDRGTTFLRKNDTPTRDVETAALDGGGTTALAATSGGVIRSNNGGDTWTTGLPGVDVREIALEYGHPTAMMLISGGTVLRSSDGASTADPEAKGLPRGCDPRGLESDASQPSTFLVTCASDGRVYRYRGDGHDLPRIPPNGLPPYLIAPRLPRTTMGQLAKVKLPADSDGLSASIAFDGEFLYYTRSKESGILHRVVARTGAAAPDLKVTIEEPVVGLTYDSLRHVMYALDARSAMFSVDLRTLAVKRLFTDPIDHSSRITSYSFDAALGRFRAVNELYSELFEVDLHGKIATRCTMATALLYQSDASVPSPGDGATSGPAAVVASGDGGVYVQNEDDSTMVRFSRSCEPLAIFDHQSFSEASDENDQVACDTNTFDVPAVWIRDAQAKAAFAFAVPGGYCALATRLRVTTSPTVANTDRAPICAELRLAGRRIPVAGESVTLYAGNHEVGTGRTGSDGVACVQYHPADFPEHVTPDQPKAGERAIDKRDREQVVANYVGTIAYRPARGTGSAVVTTFVPPLDPVRPPLPPRPPAIVPQVLEPAVIAAPPPPLPVAPPQPPPPASQPQPLAQGHPGAQPGAMGQPGAAAERQEEVEVAEQSADVREFRARRTEPVSTLPVALAGFAFASVVLEQRRRRTRVREVGA